jgi:hypothetical protein
MPDHDSSPTIPDTPENMHERALQVQATLKRLLAEINQLLEKTRQLTSDAGTDSQS